MLEFMWKLLRAHMRSCIRSKSVKMSIHPIVRHHAYGSEYCLLSQGQETKREASFSRLHFLCAFRPDLQITQESKDNAFNMSNACAPSQTGCHANKEQQSDPSVKGHQALMQVSQE
jgi:hypothetical protein